MLVCYQSLRWWSSADSPAHRSPRLRPSRTLHQVSGLHSRAEIKSSVMLCVYRCSEVSVHARWGGSVVKWPAVLANGSNAYSKHKNALMWLGRTIDGSLIAFHGKPALTVEHHWWVYRALVAELLAMIQQALEALWCPQWSPLWAWSPLIPLLTPTEVITRRALQHEITPNAQETHYQ